MRGTETANNWIGRRKGGYGKRNLEMVHSSSPSRQARLQHVSRVARFGEGFKKTGSRKVTPGKASGPEASEGPCAAGLGLLGEALAGKLGRVRPRHGSRSDFSGLWVRKRMCLK